MPYVNYTAKRKHVKQGLNVTATDISADATGDTFDSSTTDLSGLVATDFIYVSGFDSAANNGWHDVDSASSSTQIAVTSALATEAAGDIVTIVGYEHGDGESYNLDFDCSMVYEYHNVDSDIEEVEDGVPDSLLHKIDTIWSVATTIQAESLRDYWIEFLNSVANLETFTFDPYGTSSVPVNPVTVILNKPRWTMTPLDQTGQFRVSFEVREI